MSRIITSLMEEYKASPDVAVAKMNKHIKNIEARVHDQAMAAAYDKALEWFEKYGQDKTTDMILARVPLYRTKKQQLYIDTRATTLPKQSLKGDSRGA